MKIAIRMDDITPDMDWAKFLKFKELCDLYQVKPLIGVVPKNEDKSLKKGKPRADFWEYIRALQKDGWTVAQHGYTHVYATANPGLFPLNRLSEFAGVEYSEQYEAIRFGQNILKEHGIETTVCYFQIIFWNSHFPPFNFMLLSNMHIYPPPIYPNYKV